MLPRSIFGLFCEDIREEGSNVFTLVGLLPDNIASEPIVVTSGQSQNVGISANKFLTRLCVYARANFDPEDSFPELKLNLIFPDDQEVQIGGAKEDVLEQAKREAKENGSPLAGVIMRAALNGFRLHKPGVLRLTYSIGEESHLLAALNFKIVEKTTSSNEPPPPS